MEFKLIIDGVEWEPTMNEAKAVKIEAWYDRHIKLWTLYPIDEEGNQLAGASYAGNRAEMEYMKRELEVEYRI